jgi:transposase
MEIKRPFLDTDWLKTPEPVRTYIHELEKNMLQLTATMSGMTDRVEKLEEKFTCNSQNSNQPPSTDPPFNKPDRKKKDTKRKAGGQKGHKGHRQ